MTKFAAVGAGEGEASAPAQRRKVCKADGCDRPAHARGLCRRDYARWHRTCEQGGQSVYRTTIDAGPIIERIEGRGGIAVVLGYEHNTWTDHSDAVRTSKNDPEIARLTRQWHRMVKSRVCTIDTADKWCCLVLGVNPALVYGDVWWDAA